jgi:putative membrane protein
MQHLTRLEHAILQADAPTIACRFIPVSSPEEATMLLVSSIAVAVVALVHIYILALEMFLWTKPAGRKAFGFTREFALQTKVLGANLGLYNGFLAAGLIYGLFQGRAGLEFRVFFLTCVLVAGVFGAATASKKILVVQAIPATIALVLVLLAR